MKGLYIVTLLSIAFLGYGFFAVAEDSTSTPTPTNGVVPENIRKEIKQVQQNVKTEVSSLKNRVKDETQKTKDQLKTKKDDLEAKAKARKQELNKSLKKITDEAKRKTVDQIDTQIIDLNRKRVEIFDKALDQIQARLNKVKQKADKKAAQITDLSPVQITIDNAQKSIDSVRKLIKTQAGQAYKITITGETKLKSDVGKARQSLNEDLKKLDDAVKVVKETVTKAGKDLELKK